MLRLPATRIELGPRDFTWHSDRYKQRKAYHEQMTLARSRLYAIPVRTRRDDSKILNPASERIHVSHEPISRHHPKSLRDGVPTNLEIPSLSYPNTQRQTSEIVTESTESPEDIARKDGTLCIRQKYQFINRRDNDDGSGDEDQDESLSQLQSFSDSAYSSETNQELEEVQVDRQIAQAETEPVSSSYRPDIAKFRQTTYDGNEDERLSYV